MYNLLHRIADLLARVMALLGGAVLILLTVANCVSIMGRALVPFDLGIGPVRGIYDYTEIGVAAAVFAFLPWCQLNRGHATVEIATPLYPAVMNRALDVIIDVLMLAAASVIAWRLYLGMLDKASYGETTLIAQVPLWQGFAASLVGAVGFALVAAFCAIRSVRALTRGDGPRNV